MSYGKDSGGMCSQFIKEEKFCKESNGTKFPELISARNSIMHPGNGCYSNVDNACDIRKMATNNVDEQLHYRSDNQYDEKCNSSQHLYMKIRKGANLHDAQKSQTFNVLSNYRRHFTT
jgi:hypothetical protein